MKTNLSPKLWYVKFTIIALIKCLIIAAFVAAFLVNFINNTIMNNAPTTAVKVWTSSNTQFVDGEGFADLTDGAKLNVNILSNDAFRQAFAWKETIALPCENKIIYAAILNGVAFTTNMSYDDRAADSSGDIKLLGKDWIVLYGDHVGVIHNMITSLLFAFLASSVAAAVGGGLNFLFVPQCILNAERKEKEADEEPTEAAMA